MYFNNFTKDQIMTITAKPPAARDETLKKPVGEPTMKPDGRPVMRPDGGPPKMPVRGLVTMPVGGPVWVGWRECTLTRAKELESLSSWVRQNNPKDGSEVLAEAIAYHLEAARQAANAAKLKPRKRFRDGPLMERGLSNLDAAEALILNFAPPDYVLGQMPSLLRDVQCHLISTDPRRQEFERIAQRLGIKDGDDPLSANTAGEGELDKKKKSVVENERGKIVTAVRGASSAALREQLRLRSFRKVVIFTTVLMTLLAIGVALTGYFHKTWIPLCFAPEEKGEAVVVCPTAQSSPFSTSVSDTNPQGAAVRDIDDAVKDTATPYDLLVVELIGLTAAAVAAAAAIRRIRGSSERYGLPVALAAFKLPTGAITAFLGLLLMRGQFVPGLSALDTSAQILAWALVFGYAQQLFTRFVDQQGQSVLDNVRGANQPTSIPNPT
jgi:hypothetical protein